MRGNGWGVFDSHSTDHARAAASGDSARKEPCNHTTKVTNRQHAKIQHTEAQGPLIL